MNRLRFSGILALVPALASSGCAASVPLPREGDHAGDRPVIVSEPPPPPRIEIVPSAPQGLRDPVWVSGQWLWEDRRWEWQEGRWETQQRGATYAPSRLVYLSGQRLGWFPGEWRGRGSPAPSAAR